MRGFAACLNFVSQPARTSRSRTLSGICVSQIFSGLVNLAQGQIDLTYTGLTAGETCTTTLDGNCGGATTTVTHPTTTGSVIAITCTAANPTTITYSCTVC